MRGEWTDDAERCARAGVPDVDRASRSKGGIALAELAETRGICRWDRVVAAGVRFGKVLADAGHGMSAEFHHGLDARELQWAVGIPPAERRAIIEAREVRAAERRRIKEAEEARRIAEDQARLAELAARAAAEAQRKAEQAARDEEIKAQRKAERDARYAARKARR